MKLKFFRRDPNALEIKRSGRDTRGPGHYYWRAKSYVLSGVNGGKNTKVRNGYYSKYSRERDSNTESNGFEVNKIGLPEKQAKKYAHISDGNLGNYFNKWSKYLKKKGKRKK